MTYLNSHAHVTGHCLAWIWDYMGNVNSSISKIFTFLLAEFVCLFLSLMPQMWNISTWIFLNKIGEKLQWVTRYLVSDAQLQPSLTFSKWSIIIQIMHIREVVSKNYSPRGNFIKVWNTRGWKPSVFWIFIKLPRVDNFTNDRSPNVHYLFYKMVLKIWAVVSKN